MDTSAIDHIIFDLDNTLWDFSGNSKRILGEMYQEFNLLDKGVYSFEIFHHQYKFRNEYLWDQYRAGNVTREEVRLNRFYSTLNDFRIANHALAHELADYYIQNTRMQTDLLPNAVAALTYLKEKYHLHIITNGFEEVQFFKLKNSGIFDFFTTVTTAEAAQCLKPDKKIFEHALRKIHAESQRCVYIGDAAEVDGRGSINAGLNFILFNPEKRKYNHHFKFEISDLIQLRELL